MLPTNHAVQSFLYKDPSLCRSLFWRSRTQKKDVCRDRNTSDFNSSQFRMDAWQTNFLPWVFEFLRSKSLFNFFHWGKKKKAVKCHARHKQEWNLKLAASRAKLATRQGLSHKLSWEHHLTCTPAFSGWTISIFTTWGRSYSLFCLGQDPGYWHCKLRILLKISCLLSSKCHWAQSWDR